MQSVLAGESLLSCYKFPSGRTQKNGPLYLPCMTVIQSCLLRRHGLQHSVSSLNVNLDYRILVYIPAEFCYGENIAYSSITIVFFIIEGHLFLVEFIFGVFLISRDAL